MDNSKKKISLALKLYPFYEAASGDLLFFSVIQTLFLTQLKGFSPEQMAMLVLITSIVDLALEYPTYMVIRRIGNSKSCVIGGIMPLIGILMITFGDALPIITIGNIFFVSSANFQSMAGASARNNMTMLGERDNYAKLFSKGNAIYSGITMISAFLMPVLYSLNYYIPSILCIIACGVITGISFFISDYSEKSWSPSFSKEKKEPLVKVEKDFGILIIVFCLFFCAAVTLSDNMEVFLENKLSESFSMTKTIYYYGTVIWASRMLRFCSNLILPKILDWLKNEIVLVASIGMLIGTASIATSSLLCAGTMVPIVMTSVFYILFKGIIWDPMRTFLRMAAVDTNSKKKQQAMLVYLNAGQSIANVFMGLIVVGILKIYSLEYVFLAFSMIAIVIVIFCVILRKKLGQCKEILKYETKLNEDAVDEASNAVFNALIKAGMERKNALSYKVLTEEKLLGCLKEKRGETVIIIISSKLSDFQINIDIDTEESDIFEIPGNGDPVAEQMYYSLIKNI